MEITDECFEVAGGYLDCWVNCNSEEAIETAKDYANDQGWSFVSLEEVTEVKRELYLGSDDKESLEIYDEAYEQGVSGAFYTWDKENIAEFYKETEYLLYRI